MQILREKLNSCNSVYYIKVKLIILLLYVIVDNEDHKILGLININTKE
mgnify:CR=1 FL=1